MIMVLSTQLANIYFSSKQYSISKEIGIDWTTGYYLIYSSGLVQYMINIFIIRQSLHYKSSLLYILHKYFTFKHISFNNSYTYYHIIYFYMKKHI